MMLEQAAHNRPPQTQFKTEESSPGCCESSEAELEPELPEFRPDFKAYIVTAAKQSTNSTQRLPGEKEATGVTVTRSHANEASTMVTTLEAL